MLMEIEQGGRVIVNFYCAFLFSVFTRQHDEKVAFYPVLKRRPRSGLWSKGAIYLSMVTYGPKNKEGELQSGLGVVEG